MDIFQNNTKSLPSKKGDSRIVRIDMDKSDLGARKSHIGGVAKKNDNVIRHTKGS
jgi:hypothetical protein